MTADNETRELNVEQKTMLYAPDSRMEAYYYSFDQGESPVEVIQKAANMAATALESLSQTPEEEWEYAVVISDPNEYWIKPEAVAREWAQLVPTNSLVRRRPAGEWLPVKEVDA